MIDDLLDRLQKLLERQLAFVRQGRLEAALELCEQTERYVRQIAGTPAAQTCSEIDRGKRVKRLYEDLCLALTAQQMEVSDALNALRQGWRVLTAYSRTGPLRR